MESEGTNGCEPALANEAAAIARRLLEAVEAGTLTADTPAERRTLRRLEGLIAGFETECNDEGQH